ncbi:MAG: hypothetical protein IH984_02795 [Planctomycetes bacterium]|nr:hypothetical protein [Planctomycetota bacterium]
MCCQSKVVKLIAIVLALSNLPALGQNDSATTFSSPPTLGLNTFTVSCTAIMRNEIMDLADKEAVAKNIEQTALQAQINIRRLAIQLLIQGDGAEGQGILAVFNGLRLFNNRAVLDDSLNGFHALGRGLEAIDDESLYKTFSEANQALKRFNISLQKVQQELPITNSTQLDRHIKQLMWPLLPAVEIVTLQTVAHHWPTHLDINSTSQQENADNAPPDLQTTTDFLFKQIRLGLEETSLEDQTHDKINIILDWLERGWQFPEFQHRVERYSKLLLGVLEFASALENADWLKETAKQTLEARLNTAIVLFEERTTRAVGQQQLTQLLKTKSVLVRTSNLSQRRINVKPISYVFVALLESMDPDKASEPEITRKLWLIIERMMTYRELVTPKLPRDFRIVLRKLNEDYLSSEKYLLDNLARITSEPDALIDPSISSFVSDQKQYLEDLQRTVQLPQWISMLSQLVPKSANTIEKQLQKISKLLLDTNSRPGAIATLDKLGEQIRLFNPLPFESQLYTGKSAVIKTTGGRQKELAAAIAESRIAWAQAWADDVNTQETANHMLLLYRFTQLQGDAAGLLLIEEEPVTLNRWAAWELPTKIVSQRAADLPTRLKLATAAAIDGDDLTLLHQLDRIDREAPFAKLVGRLHLNLAQALADLPDGALSVLGQTTSLPGDEAWGIPLRLKLALLCRYTLEHQHAQATGQAVIAKSLETYVNQLADNLLDELNEM